VLILLISLAVITKVSSSSLMRLDIIGDYVGRIFQEGKERPRYIIEDDII